MYCLHMLFFYLCMSTLVCSLCSGVLEGARATAAAGHATQGCNAQDNLFAAVVQSSSAEKRVSGHETGGYPHSGKHSCHTLLLLFWYLEEKLSAVLILHVVFPFPPIAFMAQVLPGGAEATGSNSDSGCLEGTQAEVRKPPQKRRCYQDSSPGQRTLGT